MSEVEAQNFENRLANIMALPSNLSDSTPNQTKIKMWIQNYM